jgi:hypothetical protein
MTTTTTIHLTHTGPYAGTPFCGCDKAARAEAGDTFAHVPYSNVEAFLARPDICPACKAEWDAAADLGDDDPAVDAVEREEADGSPLGTRYALDPGQAEECAPHAFEWSEQYQEYSCGKCGETRSREDVQQARARVVTLSHGVPGVELPRGGTQACQSVEQAQAFADAHNRLTAAQEAAQEAAPEADYTVSWHGSLVLVAPATEDAAQHLRDHVSPEAQWFGGALAVEPRFLDDLVEGLREDGFTVVGGAL